MMRSKALGYACFGLAVLGLVVASILMIGYREEVSASGSIAGLAYEVSTAACSPFCILGLFLLGGARRHFAAFVVAFLLLNITRNAYSIFMRLEGRIGEWSPTLAALLLIPEGAIAMYVILRHRPQSTPRA